ncbi:MAG: arginine--tRNA ligase [Mariprofundaceae bacterium]|nr:arginine--tRNA ligase [Mariprofundaceae bacterium]
MKHELENALREAVAQVAGENDASGEIFPVVLTRPRQKEHGDYATSVAMAMASGLKKNPREIAARILELVRWPDVVDAAEIAGPGFINIRLKHASEAEVVRQVMREGAAYGHAGHGCGQKVNIEFVSANPTGPMHVGHGRGAVVGDALASVLATQGMDVHREYYINDAGAQIGMLAESVWVRARQLQGEDVDFPEGGYPGEYIVDIARTLLEKHDFSALAGMDAKERKVLIGAEAVAANMAMIRDDLKAIGIEFDTYFSERTLHESGQIGQLIRKLTDDGLVYRGVLPPPKGKEVEDYRPVEQWLFRTTQFGDDVDRPLMKQDGTPTYFAADIAYHADKHRRGFDRQIDVWGADHGGYVTRVQAAMKALTGRDGQPEIILVQMVNLTREGRPVRMSKRAGTFVTLREVVDEVGADAVRFNFLTRRADSQLDFDLEVAKQQSDENPVYYVQYAHARLCAIMRKAGEEGIVFADVDDVDVSLLVSHEEKVLMTHLLAYPEMLARAADRKEPYRVATYLMKLAGDMHSFYHKHRVISDDADLTQARLLLMKSVRQVIGNGLDLLGVHAPERM